MGDTSTHFTEERREAFIGLIAQGHSIGDACAKVSVSRTTIGKWVKKGEAGDPPAADFAGRYAEARELARQGGQARIEPEFDTPRRERFLTLLEAGRTVGEACADVGISRTTVNRWDRNGRDGKSTEAIEFSDRFAAARGTDDGPSLSKGDVLRLLEKNALNGSVQAQKILLERFDREEKEGGDGADGSAGPDVDPMDAIDAAGAAAAGSVVPLSRARSRSA